MTFAYLSSFDVQNSGLSTVQIATSGKTTISVTLSSVFQTASSGTQSCYVFSHHTTGLGQTVGNDRDQSSLLAYAYGDSSFAATLQTFLRSEATGAGWGADANSIVVSFSPSLLKYTFSYTANFTLTLGNATTESLFGYASSSLSGATFYSSTLTPNYVIVPELSCTSTLSTTDALDYEPDGISSQAVSAAGIPFGIARSVSPLYRDWTQQFELPEKVKRLSATSSHPFTHQELFEVCRAAYPFVVYDGFGAGTNEVFILRNEQAFFGRGAYEAASIGNGAQYHVHYKTLVMGTVT